MIPTVGTPRLDRRPNATGNSWSLAAASGTSAQITVHPLSAPRPEMMTASATRLPAQVPPPTIVLAATEYYALLTSLASSLLGTVPNTATIDSRYTTALPSVPSTVARGMLRVGLLTFAAATAAASTPR